MTGKRSEIKTGAESSSGAYVLDSAPDNVFVDAATPQSSLARNKKESRQNEIRDRGGQQRKTRNLNQSAVAFYGAGRGSRTPTRGEPRRILSPLRLPVPPSRLENGFNKVSIFGATVTARSLLKQFIGTPNFSSR